MPRRSVNVPNGSLHGLRQLNPISRHILASRRIAFEHIEQHGIVVSIVNALRRLRSPSVVCLQRCCAHCELRGRTKLRNSPHTTHRLTTTPRLHGYPIWPAGRRRREGHRQGRKQEIHTQGQEGCAQANRSRKLEGERCEEYVAPAATAARAKDADSKETSTASQLQRGHQS